jgi:hypothetical protein
MPPFQFPPSPTFSDSSAADGGKTIVRICRSKAAAQGDHLHPEIELSRGSRHIETIGAQNLLWPSVYCISDSVGSLPVQYHLQYLSIFKAE